MSKLRVSGLINDSIVDGPGFRYAIFTQGCIHKCEGCHNPQTHDLNGGYEVEIEQILKEIDDNPLLDGVSITGGEPMLQAEKLIPLVEQIKERGLSIIIYSGFLLEEIIKKKAYKKLIEKCDILIDGKFEKDKKSLDLLFRGSKNQRIINIQESLENGEVCLWNK